MKRTIVILSSFIVALLGAAGCSTAEKTDSAAGPITASPPAKLEPAPTPARSDSAALQGTWKGKDVGEEAEGTSTLIISGNRFEFRGADPGEWYKGTFTLREDKTPRQLVAAVAECAAPEFVGKTSYAIYRVEDDTLTMTAHAPGNPEVPEGFDSSDARRIIFRK
jgi:uncharacterized protein (TIGR03067 family)